MAKTSGHGTGASAFVVPPNVAAGNVVWNNNYPATFKQQVTLPVVRDRKKPPRGVFSTVPLPATFSLRLDDAIGLADRHLSISGRPANPMRLVRDWVNL